MPLAILLVADGGKGARGKGRLVGERVRGTAREGEWERERGGEGASDEANDAASDAARMSAEAGREATWLMMERAGSDACSKATEMRH